jgi:hypothetical protein
MADVLARVRRINEHMQATEKDPARLGDAQREQGEFSRTFDPRVTRLRDILKEMASLTDNLLDRV